jgi:hypothetical protein
MYGFDGTTPGGIEWNGGAVCNPLRKIDNVSFTYLSPHLGLPHQLTLCPYLQIRQLSTKDWFGHGVLGFPPASAVMNLPAGGYYNGESILLADRLGEYL